MRVVRQIPLVMALIGSSACEADPDRDSGRVAIIDTISIISFRGLPAPHGASRVAVSSDLDRIAVALRDGSGEILIFDGGGTFIRQIGRKGAGPGEFRDITALTFGTDTDSLWVLDEANTRISVFAPSATGPSRDVSLQGQFFGVAWASDTTLVIQGRFRGEDPANVLARALSPSGVTAAVVDEGRIALDSFDDYIRPLTSSAAGGIWVGDFREPRLRRYDTNLSRVEALSYAAPLLEVVPENERQWSGIIDTRPAVLGVTEDRSGDFWVLFGIPADPLPSVDDPGRALAEKRVTAADLASTVLARYERASLERGPAQQFEQGPARGGLLPGGFGYFFDTDAVGEPTLAVVRLDSRNP